MRNELLNNTCELISIHEFKRSRFKNYYGASKKVCRISHLEKVLTMYSDLAYLGEVYTRTRLVPCNNEFLQKKAIPTYNNTLKRLQEKYPNIKEFFYYKPI
jgi:hypothetical protein